VKRTQATPTASTETVPPDLSSALRQMLLRHRDGLHVVHDADQHFYVNCRTPHAARQRQNAVLRCGEGVRTQARLPPEARL